MSRTKVAVVGASGYTGQELLRILLGHPEVELRCVTSRQQVGQALGMIFPRFAKIPGAELVFSLPEPKTIAASGAKVAFLALPHGVAAEVAVPLLELGLKVIDLSADFRLNDPEIYEEFYGQAHPVPELLRKAVYGLPEIRAKEIAKAELIASPGCYPTSILLPLIPLLKSGLLETDSIVVNSCSGVTGAGRKADISLLFCECNESVRAYGLPKHRHLSEIEQELSIASNDTVTITFVPHLVPVNSGICTTTVARLAPGRSPKEIGETLSRAYENAPFVRLLGEKKCADTKNVTRTNFVDIGWIFDERTGRVILSSAEDNLVKGAGGQAVQAFNIMMGFPQETGLLVL